MKAIVCEGFDPLDQLKHTDVPDPPPKAGEVVVAIRSNGFPRVKCA